MMSEAVYMRLFMRIFVCIFFLLALSACGAGQFGKTYRGYLTPEEAADVVMLGEGQEPNLIRSDDIDRDVRFYREHNYIVIGESSFNGVQENPENAVRQAEEVKATHVIVSSAYTDTESRVDYDISENLTGSIEYIHTERRQSFLGFTQRGSNYVSLILGATF